MNKLLSVFSMLAIAAMIANPNALFAKKPKPEQYVCPSCNYTAEKPGQCPMDKKDLVKVGDYYCKDCHTVSTKPGTCPSCGKKMTKMTMPSKKQMMHSQEKM